MSLTRNCTDVSSFHVPWPNVLSISVPWLPLVIPVVVLRDVSSGQLCNFQWRMLSQRSHHVIMKFGFISRSIEVFSIDACFSYNRSVFPSSKEIVLIRHHFIVPLLSTLSPHSFQNSFQVNTELSKQSEPVEDWRYHYHRWNLPLVPRCFNFFANNSKHLKSIINSSSSSFKHWRSLCIRFHFYLLRLADWLQVFWGYLGNCITVAYPLLQFKSMLLEIFVADWRLQLLLEVCLAIGGIIH